MPDDGETVREKIRYYFPAGVRTGHALCCLLLIVLSGCTSLRQELHPFPEDLARMLENEHCDCSRIEFLGEDEGRYIEDGVVRGRFSYAERKLRVDVDDGFLGLMSHLSSTVTFSEVRQKVDVVNPFDGQGYVMSAVYDGENTRVNIKRGGGDAAELVGHLVSSDTGTIGKRIFRVKEDRRWAGTMEKASVDGETIWHHYPDGAYLVISLDGSHDTKIYQGAVPGKFAGMDVFSGYRSVVFVPRNQDSDYRRDLFLFYSGMVFFQEFSDTVMILPLCLNDEETRNSEECPDWIETH